MVNRRFLFLASLPLLLAGASGCTAQPYGQHVYAPVHGHRDPVVATGRAILAIAELAQFAEDMSDAQREREAEEAAPPEPPRAVRFVPALPPEPSPADTPVAPPTPFDLGGAYGAIGLVDPGACRAQGLAAGYGRLEVVFANDDSTSAVRVTPPQGSADSARSCLEGAYAHVHVAPFDGSQVTVRRNFYTGT